MPSTHAEWSAAPRLPRAVMIGKDRLGRVPLLIEARSHRYSASDCHEGAVAINHYTCQPFTRRSRCRSCGDEWLASIPRHSNWRLSLRDI